MFSSIFLIKNHQQVHLLKIRNKNVKFACGIRKSIINNKQSIINNKLQA